MGRRWGRFGKRPRRVTIVPTLAARRRALREAPLREERLGEAGGGGMDGGDGEATGGGEGGAVVVFGGGGDGVPAPVLQLDARVSPGGLDGGEAAPRLEAVEGGSADAEGGGLLDQQGGEGVGLVWRGEGADGDRRATLFHDDRRQPGVERPGREESVDQRRVELRVHVV